MSFVNVPKPGEGPFPTLEEVKIELIVAALTYHDGNKTRACETLGVSIRTLRNYVTKFNLTQFQIKQVKVSEI